MLKHLLHGYFKIAGGDDERTRREKVAGRLSMLDSSLEDTRPYLFSLLGIVEGADPLAQMDGQIRKRRTLEAIATFFAIVQVTSALVMYGKIPRVTAPSWIGRLHQWSGRIAFLVAVPVAIDCLYGLGFQTYSTRVLIHSMLGCAFFGFFTVKMLILPKRGLPGWTLPLAGAVVFTVLVGLWFTSAFWFFSTFGVHR